MVKITHSRCCGEKAWGISPKPIVVAV